MKEHPPTRAEAEVRARSVQPLMPGSVHLQLVSPAKTLPVRPGWLYEPKLDGCRVLLGKNGPTVQVRVRGGGLVQRNVPEVTATVGRLRAEHVVLDGELVVVDGAGRCDFDAACDRLKSQHGPPVTIFVFDILALEGEDLRARPLRERKSALARVLRRGDSTLRPVHFIAGPPDSMIAAVDDLELEGVVAKWEGVPYQGGRTPLWQKLVLRRPTKGWRVEEPFGHR
jgi:bifunctional non-homologous end joining protein LigD